MKDFGGALIVPTVFGSIVWVTYLIVSALLTWHRRRLSGQLHQKLLERFGSAQEFGQFLNTAGGRAFIDSLLVENPIPHERVLRAVQWGTTMLLVGATLLFIRGPLVRRGFPTDIDPTLTLLGSVTVAVGLGLLVSSGVTFALSKRLGLIDNDARRPRSGMVSA